jgi:hypothetical protein
MRLFTLAACALIVSGCAIHPLPEDTTRETTYQIVQKIRCEGREALDNISIRLFRSTNHPPSLELADLVAAGKLEVVDIFKRNSRYRKMVDPKLVPIFQAYTLSAVTFDFNFTINEENNNLANANFRLPVANGLFTLGSAAGAKFERRGIRKFQITNSFLELHTLPREACANIAARSGDLIYPITGKIGLEEVFETFVNVDAGIGIVANQATKFTDTLLFTTTFNASANPRIDLNPVSDRRFQVANASATLSAMRSDAHQVTLAIAKGELITSISLEKAIEQARAAAKVRAKLNADDARVEDFFQILRDNNRRLETLIQ